MSGFLAVLIDTWHESKRQILFRVLLGFMLLTAILIAIFPREFDRGAGQEPEFGTLVSSEPTDWFAEMWWSPYLDAETKTSELEAPAPNSREGQRWIEERIRERRADVTISAFERSVQCWDYLGMIVFFKLALLGFVGVSAGYFPRLMREGAVDAVISKPTSRFAVFAGRFVGGLTLFSVSLLTCNALVYVSHGLRLGVWHHRLFAACAFTIFVAAVLYAFLALIGLASRSAVLATVVGYGFYVLVDTGIGSLIKAIQSNIIEPGPAVEDGARLARAVIPNFTMLNDTTVASLITMPHFDWAPFATAAVWFVVTIGGGYIVFRYRDF